jgi:hypothetical protein
MLTRGLEFAVRPMGTHGITRQLTRERVDETFSQRVQVFVLLWIEADTRHFTLYGGVEMAKTPHD